MGTWRTLAVTLALLGAGSPAVAAAQGAPELYGGSGLKLTVDAENNFYIRFITWHQVWFRAMENNPGTVVDGSDGDWTTDAMLRRSRFLAYAQLTDYVLILSHWGINNQTFTNGGVGSDGFRPQIYFHDVWTEFRMSSKDYLYLGGGLLYWNGVSRMASASTLNFLALDSPIFTWATIESTDQFARQLGLYAKGDIEGFHYRMQLTRPFIRDTPTLFRTPAAAPAEEAGALFNAEANTWALTGYYNYNFLDRESNKLPYFVGSYLGTKRVLNVGAGFNWHPDALVSCAQTPTDPDGEGPLPVTCPDGASRTHDMFLLGVDAFLDLPIAGGMALTSYLAYLHYDFGPNNLRRIGIANESSNGAFLGNAYPMIGTSENVYWQVGYLLPFRPWNQHKITPYFTFQASVFEALDDPMLLYELGVKYYLVGHHASVTLHWRNRPTFVADDGVASAEEESRANELIVQLQVWL